MALAGWLKLHRALADHPIASDPHSLSIWIHLLMLANHTETKRQINGRIITLKAGQLITSRKSISEKTGVQESKVERVLKLLKSEQQIEQQGTTKFRVISIVNWGSYQSDEQQPEQQMNSRRTADEQQMNTPEEVSISPSGDLATQEGKECKEENPLLSPKGEKAKRNSKIPDPFMLTADMRAWAIDKGITIDLRKETERFVDHWRGAGTTKADWPAVWRNWMRKAQEDSQKGGRTGFKPINQQAAVEENNARVVREIEAQQLQRMGGKPDQELFNLGEPVTIEGEVINAY